MLEYNTNIGSIFLLNNFLNKVQVLLLFSIKKEEEGVLY